MSLDSRKTTKTAETSKSELRRQREALGKAYLDVGQQLDEKQAEFDQLAWEANIHVAQLEEQINAMKAAEERRKADKRRKRGRRDRGRSRRDGDDPVRERSRDRSVTDEDDSHVGTAYDDSHVGTAYEGLNGLD